MGCRRYLLGHAASPHRGFRPMKRSSWQRTGRPTLPAGWRGSGQRVSFKAVNVFPFNVFSFASCENRFVCLFNAFFFGNTSKHFNVPANCPSKCFNLFQSLLFQQHLIVLQSASAYLTRLQHFKVLANFPSKCFNLFPSLLVFFAKSFAMQSDTKVGSRQG